jgi:glyoxylase-like metal-dependent hydrolase (beta-lactamase superfamily II)/rhodanese-related sulfurtransferase
MQNRTQKRFGEGKRMLIFRQLFDPQSSTYTYLLGDGVSRQAVLIDPVFEQVRRDAALIEELELELLYTLDTHVHADHVTGSWLLKERLGSQILLAKQGDAEGVDRYLEHGDRVVFGKRYLEVRATPGHTASCLTFVLDDESRAFTGDALLIRGAGRTDFQQGDAGLLYRSVHSQVFTLPDSCLLYPGHDYRGLTATSVAEERQFNPRLGGALSENDFTGYMNNLGLAHPKQMDIAVPANLRCGRPSETELLDREPDWAPLNYTFAGIWEIQPHWVEEHLKDVQVLDVREQEEFDGPLGHIPGAKLIPLGNLGDQLDEIARDQPIVTVCRAGGRSARASLMLQQAGLPNVANLTGGILSWRAQNLVVVGAVD